MKRRGWIRILAVALVLALAVLAGCSAPAQPTPQAQPGQQQATQPSQQQEAPKQEAPAKKVSLTITLGGPTGSYYLHGAAVAEMVNRASDKIQLTPSVSGGGVENLRRVSSGEAPLGQATVPNLPEAWDGLPPFEQQYRGFRLVGPSISLVPQQFIVLEKSGIKSAKDLAGRTYVTGAPGSFAAVATEVFLEALGVMDKIQVQHFGFGELSTMLKDGVIDGFTRGGIAPHAQVLEINATHRVRVLDLKAELEESKFFEKYPTFSPYVIPKGTYDFQEGDIHTYAFGSFWIVNKDVPDDVVYELAKQMYDPAAVARLTEAYKDHEHANTDLLATLIVPLHPGAEKYWKERGVKIGEPLLKP